MMTFLKSLALVEPSEWQAFQTPELHAKVNEIAAEVVARGEPQEMQLLGRALRNYNALSIEKADPFVFRYKDYTAPEFAIPEIELVLNVRDDKVVVTTGLHVVGHGEELALHGTEHKVLSVKVDGQELSRDAYRVTVGELVLLNPPQGDSRVEILSEINPYANGSLEGLYATKGLLVTQCESEGARRIFYTLDRPDTLSTIKTTIIADKAKWPVRLSNGNLVEEREDLIVWNDPIPKPSYLFACILGDLCELKGEYVTGSGKKVALSVYGEKGNESRLKFGLEALQWAMRFDEEAFDREYDLNHLKMVAVPDFNSGAMENKGLLVFNERALLVDQESGTDGRFWRVAAVIAHEYFHNWSGNRVTVRNWFELALKEAFTEFRNSCFEEKTFGKAMVRPEHVASLRENQFPEEFAEGAHPLVAESFVNPREIYDSTTYVKGKEVFRALKAYLDALVPDGFRKAQNLYFERCDGKAVTFRELLTAAKDILPDSEKAGFEKFERWFTQQGTPEIFIEKKKDGLHIVQSQVHPKTGELQAPLAIPFSYEFIGQGKKDLVLTEREHVVELEAGIPVFLHDYSAPVIVHYDYTPQELAVIVEECEDPYLRFEAGQKLAMQVIQGKGLDLYAHLVESDKVPGVVKAQLLSLPSVRALSQATGSFDFPKLHQMRIVAEEKIRTACGSAIAGLLKDHPDAAVYAIEKEQLETRKLRAACMRYVPGALDAFAKATHYEGSYSALRALMGTKDEKVAVGRFYRKWQNDRLVLNDLFRMVASASNATVASVREIMQLPGFEKSNPNHMMAAVLVFANNLGCYHNQAGYAFVVDQILDVQKTNPHLALRIAKDAFIDYRNLPDANKQAMKGEMTRLLQEQKTPDEIRSLIRGLLVL